jgi:hypothetical protein
MNEFLAYLRHGFSMSHSFEMAFGKSFACALADFMRDMLIVVAILTVFFLVVTSLTNDADAANQDMRKVLTQCLSDSTGKPIVIGNEIFLCSIVSTGEHI